MDFDDLDDLDPVEIADPSTEERELGIIVYGASGYVGGLIIEQLDAIFSKPDAKSHAWGLAGRSKEKIRAVARKCKTAPTIIQASEPIEISQMVRRCRVLISAAGPYSTCGEDILRECVTQVTHYIDITSEVAWMNEMINKYHGKAKEKGAMIVHSVGSVSTPDEIMSYTLAKKLGPLKQFREYFRQSGGISGGIIDTRVKTAEQLTPDKLAVMNDPFSLGGVRECGVRAEDWDSKVENDPLYPSIWLTSTYDMIPRSRIIRRTNSLFEEMPSDGVDYGKNIAISVRDWSSNKRSALQHFQQDGYIPSIEHAAGVIGQAQLERERGRMPASGKGPAAADRRNNSVSSFAVAEGENGDWAHALYKSGDALEVTAMVAVASALVLVEELDVVKPRDRAGVITPAFAFHGSTWIERLTTGTFTSSKTPLVQLTVKDGQLPQAVFDAASGVKPNYALCDPLPSGWHMPALEGPEPKGKTAWPAYEPMSDEQWQKYPRAGRGAMPGNMGEFKKVVNELDKGEFWGIEFPYSPMQLKEMGPKWLTKAFHITGAMPKDNEIVEITKFSVKAWDVTGTDPNDADFGGAGCKVFMDIKYKKNPGELSEHLFVKMPHEFNGKNERFKNSMGGQDWNECMFYNLLGGRLPFRTPRTYFGDMSRKTTNFCLILETVPYGHGWNKEYKPEQLLPNPSKYRDWLVPKSPCADIYFAHARCQAQFYGWYRNLVAASQDNQVNYCFREEGDVNSRRFIFGLVAPLSKQERNQFFISSLTNPDLASYAYGSDQPPNIAEGYVLLAEEFVGKHARHTMPRQWTHKAYFDQWIRETKEMCPYLSEMAWYSQMLPEYYTFAHPNLMIDNAFYWRDEKGLAQAGLLDWGGAGHMTMPRAVAGCWIASEVELMDEYEEQLSKCLLDEYEKVSGVRLDFDEFYLHLKLAYIGIHVGNCASVRWCNQIRPKDQWGEVVDRFDGKIDDGFMMRCYHVQTELFLGMWEKRNPYPYFKKWMEITGIPKKQ